MTEGQKLIIVGQTPPPYNGQAKMILQMIDGLSESSDLIHIRMAYSDSVVSAGKFAWRKIVHLFELIRRTRSSLKTHPGSILYYPPASPNLMPVCRDICFLLAVRRLAGGAVLHFHSGGVSSFVKSRWWLRPFAQKAYGNADVAIELGASCPRDGLFFQARKVIVVPNGLDVPVCNVNSELPEGSVLNILYVGIHTAEKGVFDLLKTARELKGRGVSFEIRTAGLWYSDDERARFDALCQEWGLESSVVCQGKQIGEALWSLYKWADVFFFPTFYSWETFGIVQIEAMAFGLPVVASDWSGPKDVVNDGVSGVLCPPHDIVKFADVLEKLAGSSSLRLQLGRAGRARYEEMYTAAHFIKNMKSVFKEAGL